MPGLNLNMGQQLRLTPQLQQSIKILQYSALEIQQTITATLESNFMLELEDENQSLQDNTNTKNIETTQPILAAETAIKLEKSEIISAKLEIDCEWEDVYSDFSNNYVNKSSSAEYTSAENYTAAEINLKDKLSWQSDTYQWQEQQELIASFLIDGICDEGYLKIELSHIQDDINNNITPPISLEQIQETLTIIQSFEPTGVGSRNLAECLNLQLKALPNNPFVVTAMKIIMDNFELLSLKNYKKIKKIYLLNDEELQKVIQIIQSLNPRPGRVFSADKTDIIIPDLKLSRTTQGFNLELNKKAFPRLAINSVYIDIAANLGSSKDSKKIKEQLVEAKGLITSIKSRGETLLKVGLFIIKKQANFFEEGDKAMIPMVLADVAEHLDMHESTISRATNQKYIQTPRGTFELKYFFSTSVSKYGSSEQSAISIKYHIKQLIYNENTNKPLSDNKIMELLEENNIYVARRTIAKYREAMNIGSSSARKHLNKFT